MHKLTLIAGGCCLLLGNVNAETCKTISKTTDTPVTVNIIASNGLQDESQGTNVVFLERAPGGSSDDWSELKASKYLDPGKKTATRAADVLSQEYQVRFLGANTGLVYNCYFNVDVLDAKKSALSGGDEAKPASTVWSGWTCSNATYPDATVSCATSFNAREGVWKTSLELLEVGSF
ncbi:MAG: hypothetical protein AAFY82_08035 [Pseudomonadota bacterium]